jgi:hypothetical protein
MESNCLTHKTPSNCDHNQGNDGKYYLLLVSFKPVYFDPERSTYGIIIIYDRATA